MKFFIHLIKPTRFINIVFFLTLLTTLASRDVNARLRDQETTRLISSSGAGIGSILLNESAFLNPASIYFFQTSTFYYQKGSSRLDNSSSQRTDDFKKGENQILLLTDTSSALKGAFSYQTQSENGDDRKRFSSSASSNLGPNASFGILYRYTEDDQDQHKVYHQGIFGISYIYDKKLTLGAILVDPFLANKEDTRLAGGIQYALAQNFLLIADVGVNYNDDPEENRFWKAAFQAQFLKDFFLRYGQFDDGTTDLRGHSWGLSWIGPRLALEYAYRRSEAVKDGSTFYEGEELEEHSLALSLVF